ncbi:hypothetical protein IEN85_19920 [Pelagicoccus sp. NFK12]|uniref:Uncharacterized protein n=1 Tax=Pelagicoccus enzymogenes TaxID=2773457 RepID=A0A927FBG1_9BACT|nr:hypothetical protein [Pelagicoccus enzymogenes]MBD5781779.1 hypothetical protein [Pelagicoccus enzymogenes]
MIQPSQQNTVPKSRIHCTIQSAKRSLARDIGKIAKNCAIDLKLPNPLSIRETVGRSPHVTLTVDIEFALSQHTIWKLASRIASFCPQAGVSTHIVPKDQLPSALNA